MRGFNDIRCHFSNFQPGATFTLAPQWACSDETGPQWSANQIKLVCRCNSTRCSSLLQHINIHHSAGSKRRRRSHVSVVYVRVYWHILYSFAFATGRRQLLRNRSRNESTSLRLPEPRRYDLCRRWQWANKRWDSLCRDCMQRQFRNVIILLLLWNIAGSLLVIAMVRDAPFIRCIGIGYGVSRFKCSFVWWALRLEGKAEVWFS